MDRTRVVKQVGIIGFPIKHSISPVFQQAAFDFHHIPARYEAWETPLEDVPLMVARLRGPDYLGMNVTVPHKQAVLPLLDVIDPLAQRIGAVNTIVNRGGRLHGYNTDAAGFLQALEREAGYDVAGKRVLVIGAGGAARAVCFALLDAGVDHLTIANRKLDRAVQLASDLRLKTGFSGIATSAVSAEELDQPMSSVELVVNATSVGMLHTAEERALPLPASLLRSELMVYDLVYNPPQTPLLRAAASLGARTIGGLPMLIYQGVAAFELWTGRQAPVGLMFERAKAALNQ